MRRKAIYSTQLEQGTLRHYKTNVTLQVSIEAPNRVVLREASNVRVKFRRETPNLEPQSHNLFATLNPKP